MGEDVTYTTVELQRDPRIFLDYFRLFFVYIRWHAGDET